MGVSAGELRATGLYERFRWRVVGGRCVGGRYVEIAGVGSTTQHLDGGENITCSLLSVSTRYTAGTRENVWYRRRSCDKQATRRHTAALTI